MTLHRKKQKTLSGVSNARWTAYAAAGAASAIACATNAEAVIHVFDVGEAVNASPGGITGTSAPLANSSAIIFATHSRNSSALQGHAFFGLLGFNAASRSVAFNGFTGNGFAYVSKLAAGANIAALPFIGSAAAGRYGSLAEARGTLANEAGYTASQWLDKGQGYAGFKFNIGNGVQYGWVSITMDGAPGDSFTLDSYAYGDVGDTVFAGEVPEPGSLALLAVGGAGLLAWRKRRKPTAYGALPA